MQPETQFAASFGEQSAFSEQAVGISEKPQPQPTRNSTSSSPNVNRRLAKFDTVSAAIVVGGTVQFVTFIFGLVTEFVPRVFDNILLSVFFGLCVGVIAYALMKGSD